MLPSLIPIPSDTAAAFRVRGQCTGRDIAWAMALLLQAVGRGEDGEVAIPDNGTRQLLGLKRRDRIEVEEARWRRLRRLRICGRPAPTVQFSSLGGGGEWPVRHTSESGDLTVVIDGDLADMFSDRHDDVVYLPLRLLQGVDGRYTIPLFMRMLCWTIGDYPRTWGVTDTANRVKLRIPLEELYRMLDLPRSLTPSKVISRVLEPACEEITTLTDYEIAMTPRIARTTGRIRDVEVTIIVLDVEAAVAEMEAAEQREGSWRRKDRPSRKPATERKAPAAPVTVSQAALDAAVPLSVRRPEKMDPQEKASNATDTQDPLLDPFVPQSRSLNIEF